MITLTFKQSHKYNSAQIPIPAELLSQAYNRDCNTSVFSIGVITPWLFLWNKEYSLKLVYQLTGFVVVDTLPGNGPSLA